MSTTHLQADTYPYRPGTTSRAGNPCSTGSAAPFIATATSASRPSRTTDSGVPDVNPSVDVHSSCDAPACRRASRSSEASDAPSHFAFPMYGPPTGFDTQHRVM